MHEGTPLQLRKSGQANNGGKNRNALYAPCKLLAELGNGVPVTYLSRMVSVKQLLYSMQYQRKMEVKSAKVSYIVLPDIEKQLSSMINFLKKKSSNLWHRALLHALRQVLNGANGTVIIKNLGTTTL